MAVTMPFESEMSAYMQELIKSIDSIQKTHGDDGVHEVFRVLQSHVQEKGIFLYEKYLNTPYINTIPMLQQPIYPGDIELEKSIENIIR